MKDEQQKFLLDDTVYITKLTKKFVERKPFTPGNPFEIKAFIPGVIGEIFVKEGDAVKKGQSILVLEAMKMKNQIKSHMNAKVKRILVKQNEVVSKNQLLIELESLFK